MLMYPLPEILSGGSDSDLHFPGLNGFLCQTSLLAKSFSRQLRLFRCFMSLLCLPVTSLYNGLLKFT